jgi:hypothetical protein
LELSSEPEESGTGSDLEAIVGRISMKENNQPSLSFNHDLDERAEMEIENKGWFEQAIVHLPDGKKLQVCFWDPIRLAQDLETDLKSRRACLAEPGMIVIPKITVGNMEAAVKDLYENGYFDRLQSLIT